MWIIRPSQLSLLCPLSAVAICGIAAALPNETRSVAIGASGLTATLTFQKSTTGNQLVAITIRNSASGQTEQTISGKALYDPELETYPVPCDSSLEHAARFEDVDFDGNLDMMIHNSCGAQNHLYRIFRYDSEQRNFQFDPVFSARIHGSHLQFDRKKEKITCSWHISATETSRLTYQVKNGKLFQNATPIPHPPENTQ